MESRRCIVRGRVQGVGFRWFVVRNADELGITGTVRNRPDGTVEALFQADTRAALEAMLDRIREGPPAARVDAVEVRPENADIVHDDMSIVR